MASRRPAATEKQPFVGDGSTQEPSSSTAPAVPMHVIYKLLTATFLMVFAPIAMYFLTVNTVFSGNTTWAGATAAFTANVVLIGYIIVAVKEDQGEEPRKVGKIE